MAIETVIIPHNPSPMTALQSLRFRDFSTFVAWVGNHWHDSQALQHAQWLISPFVAMAQRGQPEADAWRTASWLMPEGHEANGSTEMVPLALRWLDADAAKRLLRAAQPDKELQLCGLTELDEPTARVLAGHQGSLNLSGLRELTPEVSTALSSHLGLIRLDGLEAVGGSLTPLALRRGPRGTAQPGLSLGGLTRLNPVIADLLAQVQGDLHLNGLRDVDVQQAQWLSQRQGDSDKRLGTLHLDGWRHPSPEALRALSAYRRVLSLGAWSPPADGAAAQWAALAAAPRDGLILGAISSLSAVNAQALAKLQLKRLSLPGIKALDANLVEHLGPMVLLTLALDEVVSATAPLIKRLVQLQDKNISGLSLAGLHVTPDVRAELEAHSNLKAPDLSVEAAPASAKR